MKQAYPILILKEEHFFVVDIPDFQIGTQGESIAEALEMARDAIGIMGIDMEDENEILPMPTDIHQIIKQSPEDIVTLVDVDFTTYRRQREQRTVRKNCTIPSWLSIEAEKAGVNFSALLQSALKAELNIT